MSQGIDAIIRAGEEAEKLAAYSVEKIRIGNEARVLKEEMQALQARQAKLQADLEAIRGLEIKIAPQTSFGWPFKRATGTAEIFLQNSRDQIRAIILEHPRRTGEEVMKCVVSERGIWLVPGPRSSYVGVRGLRATKDMKQKYCVELRGIKVKGNVIGLKPRQCFFEDPRDVDEIFQQINELYKREQED